MRRRLAAAAAGLALVVLLPACGKANRESDRLHVILVRSEKQSSRFVYTDQTSVHRTQVSGVIADDFRWKALVTIDGVDAVEEVVSDDAVADRFLDPARIVEFQRKATPGQLNPVVPGATPGSVVNGVSAAPDVVAALDAKVWVVDDAGAPTVVPKATERRVTGDDPVIDAVGFLRTIDLARLSLGSSRIRRYNPEDLQYKASEDPFPPPKKGSGVDRFDFVPPPLPEPSRGGANAFPSPGNFLKVGVYVKNGEVIEIRTTIDVARRLADMERIYGVKFPANTSTKERVDIAVGAINQLLKGRGNDPLVVRTRVIRFERVSDASVVLPAEAVKGSLAFLVNRGHITGKTPSTATAAPPSNG